MDGQDAAKLDLNFRAWKLCRQYLQGAWKHIQPEDIVVRQISGGLSNLMFYCALPPKTKARGREPTEVLLRLFGQTSLSAVGGASSVDGNGNDCDSGDDDGASVSAFRVVDNLIFAILSERGLGPRLLGVFAEGRLEEFLHASRPMTGAEMRDRALSDVVAQRMAKVHSLVMPVNKEDVCLLKALAKYEKQICQMHISEVRPENRVLAEKMLGIDFAAEIEWLRKFLSRVNSPVLFCHNDLQRGNILLRHDNNSSASAYDRVSFIDFEFCGYNYRAFDLANHFLEWTFDYTEKKYPYYRWSPDKFPTKERQMDFFRSYLSSLDPSSSASACCASASVSASSPVSTTAAKTSGRACRSRHLSSEQQSEILFREVQAFLLAPNLLWTMWAMLQSTNKMIEFGYWEYARDRMSAYEQQKSAILAQLDSSVGGSMGVAGVAGDRAPKRIHNED